MFLQTPKSNERRTWKVFGRVKPIFWIRSTYEYFGTTGVSNFFKMANEKLFQVYFN
jgi:hypothetical protein